MVGVDDFAPRRRHRYATIIIDAETGERSDVLPDRAEAIRQALPDAVQVSDRWHLWRNLCDKVLAEVRAHVPCWAHGAGQVRQD